MKAYQFSFNGHIYFSPSMKEFKAFKKMWDKGDFITELWAFKCWWKIKGIERGPGWVLMRVDDLTENRVEYA